MSLSQGNISVHYELLIHNVNLATLNEASSYGIVENALIAINQGKIARIIAHADKLDETIEAEQVIDGNQGWLTPGLIDCHTHLVYDGNRANEFEMRLQGASYQAIAKAGGGILSTVKQTRAASFEQLFDSAAKRLSYLIDEGVTHVEIKSGYGLDLENETKMLEVARHLQTCSPISVSKTFLGAHALPPEYQGRADDYIELVCEVMMPELHSKGLIDCVDAFCEGIGFNTEQVRKLFEKAKSLGLPVKLHAEQLSDLKGAVLAAEYQALSVDHLEHLAAEDVAKLKQAGTVATLLPGAFYFLNETKLPPIHALRDQGVPMAIATDSNPGSSPCLSLLLMLNMATRFFKLTPLEALQGVTINAAKALGLDQQIGSIEVGKQADLVLWDIKSPAELSYRIGGNPRVSVFKAGVKIA